MRHFVPSYFIDPLHPITIAVIGCGGTGSLFMTKMVQVNQTLIALGKKGIAVTCYDPDIVTEANKGRQNFTEGDIGKNKAAVLVARINKAFGFAWCSEDRKFDAKTDRANIIVTCVDSGKARVEIARDLKAKFVVGEDQHGQYVKEFGDADFGDDVISTTNYEGGIGDHMNQLDLVYWLDMGNGKDFGQVILGTIQPVKQPNGEEINTLPTICDRFPDLEKNDKDDTPSCSVAEAIGKQDLPINAMMADWGFNLIWQMLTKYVLTYCGCYVNLTRFSVNPIQISK